MSKVHNVQSTFPMMIMYFDLKWNSFFPTISHHVHRIFRARLLAARPPAVPAVSVVSSVVSAVIPEGVQHPGAGTVVIDGAFEEARHVARPVERQNPLIEP